MKVLLRRNVLNLGKIGEVVEVKAGYARNFLLPQRYAVAPSESNLKAVEAEKEDYLKELARQKAELEAKALVVQGKEITISARANEEGHLYGSVGPAQIAAVAAKDGLIFNIQDLILEEPIRRLDRFAVKVQLADEVLATVYVKVISPTGETGPAPKPVEAAEETEDAQGEEAPAAEEAPAQGEQE